MNQPNRQKAIITSALIISVSVIVCVGLAVGGMFFLLDSPDYVRAGIIGVILGLVIGIILSLIINRNNTSQQVTSETSLNDPRFDVYTRNYMVSRLEEEIARVKIQRANLAVAFVELVYSESQHMKDPKTSNKLVKKAIKQIEALIPSSNILGYDEGNTFMVIMPETTEQEAILRAQDMYASITEKPITLDGSYSTDFKVIIGIVENNNGIQDTDNVLQLARRALLSAWGARFDSIGFVSGFRTASINTVQVEIVAFGAIGEFAVESVTNENFEQQFDETIPVRPDDFMEFDLNVNSDEDTLSVSPPIENPNPNSKQYADNVDDIITQPISPFILDSLSDGYLADIDEHDLTDIETPNSLNINNEESTDQLVIENPAEIGDIVDVDDLSRIDGIGPRYAEILTAAGITTYAQIAAMSEDEIVEIIQSNGGRRSSSMSTWAEQAKYAAEQDWDGLEKLKETFGD